MLICTYMYLQTSSTSYCITYFACMLNSCISSANSGGQPKSDLKGFNWRQWQTCEIYQIEILTYFNWSFTCHTNICRPKNTDSTVEIRSRQDPSDSAPAMERAQESACHDWQLHACSRLEHSHARAPYFLHTHIDGVGKSHTAMVSRLDWILTHINRLDIPARLCARHVRVSIARSLPCVPCTRKLFGEWLQWYWKIVLKCVEY